MMRLMTLSLAICALSIVAGTAANAEHYRVLSQPAVVGAPLGLAPAAVCHDHTFFRLHLLGMDLIRLGDKHCDAVLPVTQTMSQVIAPACTSQAAVIEKKVEVPAVIAPPAPTSKTVLLHDTETTTTVTRTYRLR